MQHITMFLYSDNKLGFLQVVTNSENKKQLESIGFVDHVDKVKKPAKKNKRVTKNAE